MHFITKTNMLNFLLNQTRAYCVEFPVISNKYNILRFICAVVSEEKSVLKARFLFLKNGALLHFMTKTYNSLNFPLTQTILFILCYGICTQLVFKSEAFLELHIRFLFLKNEALLHFVTEI